MIYWQFVFLSLSMLHFFPYLCRNYCQLEQTWKRWTTRKFPFNNSSIFLSQPSLHFILQSAVSFGTSTQALDNNEISVMHTSIDFFVPLFATHNDALCTQWRLCSVFHIQTHTRTHLYHTGVIVCRLWYFAWFGFLARQSHWFSTTRSNRSPWNFHFCAIDWHFFITSVDFEE